MTTTPGGDVGRSRVAGPVYPPRSQSQQDPVYDIKIINPVFERKTRSFHLITKEGDFSYFTGDHSFRFNSTCHELSVGLSERSMTTKEIEQFIAIVEEKSKGDKKSEDLVKEMLQDYKSFGVLSQVCDNGRGTTYFEIPDKNICIGLRHNPDRLTIYEYKTHIPAKIFSPQEDKQMGKVSVLSPNASKIKIAEWVEITDPIKLKEYKKLAREFFPNINWDEDNPYYKDSEYDITEEIPKMLEK